MTLKGRKIGTDMIVGLVFFAVCIVLGIKVLEIKTTESRILPLFALAVISVSSIFLMAKTFLVNKPASFRLLHSKREFIVWVLFSIMVIMMRVVGFYPSIFLFTVAVQLYLKETPGRRTIQNSVIYGIALTLITYVVFTFLFRMQLPLGLIFN